MARQYYAIVIGGRVANRVVANEEYRAHYERENPGQSCILILRHPHIGDKWDPVEGFTPTDESEDVIADREHEKRTGEKP